MSTVITLDCLEHDAIIFTVAHELIEADKNYVLPHHLDAILQDSEELTAILNSMSMEEKVEVCGMANLMAKGYKNYKNL